MRVRERSVRLARASTAIVLWMLIGCGPRRVPEASPEGASQGLGRLVVLTTRDGIHPMDSCFVSVLGTKLSTMTNKHGHGVIDGIPVGSYEVIARRRGILPVVEDVRFGPAQTETLRINMGRPRKVVPLGNSLRFEPARTETLRLDMNQPVRKVG